MPSRTRFFVSQAGDNYSDAELEFMQAMERYKREKQRPFPTWSEVLEVFRELGYRKVAPPEPLPVPSKGVRATLPKKG